MVLAQQHMQAASWGSGVREGAIAVHSFAIVRIHEVGRGLKKKQAWLVG